MKRKHSETLHQEDESYCNDKCFHKTLDNINPDGSLDTLPISLDNINPDGSLDTLPISLDNINPDGSLDTLPIHLWDQLIMLAPSAKVGRIVYKRISDKKIRKTLLERWTEQSSDISLTDWIVTMTTREREAVWGMKDIVKSVASSVSAQRMCEAWLSANLPSKCRITGKVGRSNDNALEIAGAMARKLYAAKRFFYIDIGSWPWPWRWRGMDTAVDCPKDYGAYSRRHAIQKDIDTAVAVAQHLPLDVGLHIVIRCLGNCHELWDTLKLVRRINTLRIQVNGASISTSQLVGELIKHPEIQSLRISNVKLDVDEFLLDMPNLKVLVVTGTNLKRLHDAFWKKLPQLQIISLQGNMLESVPSMARTDIRECYLGKNKLSTLPAFSSTIEHACLTMNKITSVSSLSHYPLLKSIDIRSNPIHNNPLHQIFCSGSIGCRDSLRESPAIFL